MGFSAVLAALLERPNPKQFKLIVRLERYERGAWAKQKRALKCLLRERKSVVTERTQFGLGV